MTAVHHASYMEGIRKGIDLAKIIVTMPKDMLKNIGFICPASMDEYEYSCAVIEKYEAVDILDRLNNEDVKIGDEMVNTRFCRVMFIIDIHKDDNEETRIDGITLGGALYTDEPLSQWAKTGKTVYDSRDAIIARIDSFKKKEEKD